MVCAVGVTVVVPVSSTTFAWAPAVASASTASAARVASSAARHGRDARWTRWDMVLLPPW